MVPETGQLRDNVAQSRLEPATLACMVAGGFALAYPTFLALMFQAHSWILEANGRPSVTDFLVLWLSGRSALHGAAAAVYDPQILHAAEAAAAGHEFTTQLPWRYPPLFLFVAAALALLPYVQAFLVWICGTLLAFNLAVYKAARSPAGLLLACATPAVFINAIGGQNGPLTAALIGAALLNLERRPVLSGIFFALLTYKPQFGILVPLVLIAGGYWRALVAATIASAGVILACWMIFGAETLRAFLHFLPITSNALLVHGANGFHNLQTVYGLARWAGWGNGAAWVAQGTLIAVISAAIVWLWRRDVPFALKAASFAAATLLATPHLYVYDFAILSLSFAFLYRERPFDALELTGIAAANLCIGAFLFFPTPIGLIAIAITIGLIVRRCIQFLAAPAGSPVSVVPNYCSP
jgi:arabinofuranan 3-O-arabinosyltransferase